MRERIASLTIAAKASAHSEYRWLLSSTAESEELKRSVCSYGFGCIDEAIAPMGLARLQSEAEAQRTAAAFAQRTEGVRYQARIAPLGIDGEAFLFGSEVLELLCAATGERFLPTEQSCCITYYGEGDHLGLHRDQPPEDCVVTAIFYLAAYSPSPAAPYSGLNLRVYGQDEDDTALRLTIPTVTGAVVIGRGSKFWHERPELKAGEYVTALTGCYRHAI